MSGCDHRRIALDDGNPTPLPRVQFPAVIRLGVVEQGGQQNEVVRAFNLGKTTIQVTRFETSCDCVTIWPLQCEISPGEPSYFRVVTNFADDPGFVGDLRVEARGYNQRGEIVLETQVMVSVVARGSLKPIHATGRQGHGRTNSL